MDYIFFISLTGTIFMLPAYIYFYVFYRERYMGIWLISWCIFFARMVFFDYGPFAWKESGVAFTLFQVMIIGNSLTFVWGTYFFIGKPLAKLWWYSAVAAFMLSGVATILQLHILVKLLPPLLYGGLTLMYIGKIFLRDVQIRGIGNYITGYAFIVWGVLTIAMPYTVTIPWLSPLCYMAAGFSRLIITMGILAVYFERNLANLARKESQYRLLAENAVDVIYRLRMLPEMKFEYVSPSALAVTGHSPEEYYADAGLLTKLVHPDDLPLYSKIFKNPTLSSDLPLTFRLVCEHQDVVWLEQKSVPTFDKDGNVAVIEGILRDVTARKNMEQLFFQAEKMNMVGQMAVSVAHEIRNPLTSVRGYLQMIRMKEDCRHKERFDLMIDELDRTNTIISEYLLLAKDKIPDRKRCSLNSIIDSLFPLLQANAIAAKAAITLSLDSIPPMFLDENEIRQLLFNLVNNGLEAMPAGGELLIRTLYESDRVELTVSDQGIGIPPHVLANLGTPFLTTKSNGTGLGLPVCYRIANRHDATIDVQTSERGTTFRVRFYLLQPAV